MMDKMHKMLWNRYSVITIIGKGTFGEVYKVTRIADGRTMAMKIENNGFETSRLVQEYKIYKKIITRGVRNGIPKIYEFLQTPDYNILVMELLGSDLEKLFENSNKQFSLSSVLHIGIDIINLIHNVHKTGFIHRDIKPNNFMTGFKDKSKIFLMDFGLSKEYIKSDGSHIHETFDKNIIGTARYSSINMHMGFEPSRRDDLESIGYVLVYFLIGKLPWQGVCKKRNKEEIFEEIGKIKLSTPLEKLCNNLPPCFQQYIEYCRTLKFDEHPNYNYLINLFQNTIKEYHLQKKYEWL